MALHPQFPKSPYVPLLPDQRWVPTTAQLELLPYEQLLPPLVAHIRKEVAAWRAGGYKGASNTSAALLHHWFETNHLLENADGSLAPFRYYFAQREAVETVIWLYEIQQARDKFDLMRFDASGVLSAKFFPEDWPRYVLKMATGSGKTKVLALLIAWCFFHKRYEPDSSLARNFLLIAPNIIVLDRLRADFDGLRIFFNDPILPPNGHAGHNWRDDFQLTLHLQDEVRLVRETGNLFLTNIHRVFLGDVKEPSLDDDDLRDYFLADAFGKKPVGKTTDSKLDLGEIVREINELAVFNDEAHHIHDERLAWFKSIQDIHHQLLQRDRRLSLQIDVTATPRHNNGSIFAQTVSDYPLVEAIHQDVVKHPILPDADSRAKLKEHKTAIFSEHYSDYLKLAVEEWRKSYAEHQQLGKKKAILFVMVDDTKNCDEVGEYLQKIAPELQDAVLVIHTKNNGEISEASSGKKQEELDKLRKEANNIDSPSSPYKAIVSVLMLKEGWDVRNVTVICGLRPYAAKANILPEQTLGRGLRRMYFGNDLARETVSVLGTPAFMDFVESIQSEGVTLEHVPMGEGTNRNETIVVEIDTENEAKDIASLDIAWPSLTRRYNRNFKSLEALDPSTFGNKKIPLKPFSPEEAREITFKSMLSEEAHHTIKLDGASDINYRSVVAFFAQQLLRDLRLVGGYEWLYPRIRDFMQQHLFSDAPVNLDDPIVLRNIAEPDASKILYDTFKRAINDLTVEEASTPQIEGFSRLTETRPFRIAARKHTVPKKSVFNKIVGEPHSGGLELRFAAFLDAAPDVQAFAKNYLAVGFRLDYVQENGDLSNYIPDFIARTHDGTIWIVETKGREELNLPQKMARLKIWCEDATRAAENGQRYDFIYMDETSFTKHAPQTFAALAESFTEYHQ